MTGLETAITLLDNIFFKTGFANQYWILQFAILIGSMAFITRKVSDWKTLLLPIMVGWQYFGMHFNWMFYSVATVLFVISTLSMDSLSGAIGAVQETMGIVRKEGGVRQTLRNRKTQRETERMNIREEMSKMRMKIDSEGLRQEGLKEEFNTNLENIRQRIAMGEATKQDRELMNKLEIEATKRSNANRIAELATAGTINKSQERQLYAENAKDSITLMNKIGSQNRLSSFQKGKRTKEQAEMEANIRLIEFQNAKQRASKFIGRTEKQAREEANMRVIDYQNAKTRAEKTRRMSESIPSRRNKVIELRNYISPEKLRKERSISEAIGKIRRENERVKYRPLGTILNENLMKRISMENAKKQAGFIKPREGINARIYSGKNKVTAKVGYENVYFKKGKGKFKQKWRFEE